MKTIHALAIGMYEVMLMAAFVEMFIPSPDNRNFTTVLVLGVAVGGNWALMKEVLDIKWRKESK